MFEILQKIKNKLSTIAGQNVSIGLEGNLTANQCPFIRIISLTSKPSKDNSYLVEGEIRIIYGEKINIKTNLEDIYQKIYKTEENIKAKMRELEKEENLTIEWIETIPDGDELQNLKASATIFNITFAQGGYLCP